MKDLEKGSARTEALKDAAAQRSSSANRNRFWAGLNRYLETEVEHEHKAAKQEQEEAKQQMRAASRSRQ